MAKPLIRLKKLREGCHDQTRRGPSVFPLQKISYFSAYLTPQTFAMNSLCGGYDDVATAGLLDNWIDEAEQRLWFLLEPHRLTMPEASSKNNNAFLMHVIPTSYNNGSEH
ncbi:MULTISPECIES: ferritin family protein [Paraburkholderia]|uniref:hypothetical protein n=1 Tax=Paraburkholderia TaxID=1822464 RepID=UPI0038BA0875